MTNNNGLTSDRWFLDIQMQVARHDELIKHLCEWQKKQNGRLERLEEKLDKFLYLLLSAFVTGLLNLILLLVRR